MRVTEKLRYGVTQERLARLQTSRLRVNEQVSTGLRINRPSDDPVGALKVDRFTTVERQNASWLKNVDEAETLLRAEDGALIEVMDLLQQAKEIAIQGIDSSLTQQDADLLGDQLVTLREQLRSLANTRVQGRYVFGGFQTRVEPYDVNFLFQGDNGRQELDIADSLRVAVAPPGGTVFGDGTPATQDVFQNLIDLEAEIRARNEINMQNEFDLLELSLEQVVQAQTDIGLRLQRVDAARTINARVAERVLTDRALVEDADLPTAIAELARVDNAFQAAVAAGARFMNGTSLLDFLR